MKDIEKDAVWRVVYSLKQEQKTGCVASDVEAWHL